MSRNHEASEFDAIVVGSGTCGATIARALSKQGKKVLILERGGNAPLKESFMAIVAMADEVVLGEDKMSTVRAITTGGSTSLYFGVATSPPLDAFRAVGIDLSDELKAIKTELPIAPLPDELLTAQTRKLRDSAGALGHAWQKNDMFVDLSKCTSGYSYEAKWKARSYVEDAIQAGAVLINRATAHKIIVDRNAAIGVEYKIKTSPIGSEVRQAYASKIILAAGELASPKILRDSGVQGVGDRGFYCKPGYAIYGLVPGLGGTSGFVASMSCFLEEDIELGDANIPRSLHGGMMLGGLKLKHLFAFPETIGIGVSVKDGYGGELKSDGRFRKAFTAEEHSKLSKGKKEAIRVLENAGATNIVDFGLTATGRVGGLVRIREHVDANLETQFRNLHVCDGSVLPDEVRGTPTLTLVCLGKYLSRHLLSSL